MNSATEFPFTLPHGYVDADGVLHRDGAMRLATANDEIAPIRDPRVQTNPAYLAVILLARVITRMGKLQHINSQVIEGLYAADFADLEEFSRRINTRGHTRLQVECPGCGKYFEVEVDASGEQ